MIYKIEIDSEAEFIEVKQLLVDNFQRFKIESEAGSYNYNYTHKDEEKEEKTKEKVHIK